MNLTKYRVPVVLAITALALSACSSPGEAQPSASAGSELISVANVVPGNLGDQSFFDDAESGIVALKADGHPTDTLQADANNPSQWKANLESVSTGDWDIVVLGSPAAADTLIESAPKFPDQKYLYYDGVIDAPNVASLTFKQNEGSFLAGVLAAIATTDRASFPLSSGSKKVGLVGGMDIPVINDFAEGFKSGVEAVDPSVEVIVSYVGSFGDSAKGYDQAKAMFSQGVDVVYQVAGGSGVGVLQAAADADKYGIGVDSNQNSLQPGHILASMLKRVGTAIVQAVEGTQDGTFEYGKEISFGLANDGVDLTFDDNEGIVPQQVIDQIDDYKQQVVSGDITVPSIN